MEQEAARQHGAMVARTDSGWTARFAKAAGSSALLGGCAFLAILAFAGLDVELVSQGYLMPASGAVCFALAGVALWYAALADGHLRADRAQLRYRRISRTFAGGAALTGMLRLTAELAGIGEGAEWLLTNISLMAPGESRIIPVPAVAFILVGGAIWMANDSRWRYSFHVLAVSGWLAGWIGFTQYLFGGEFLFARESMTLPTAILLMVLSLGVLFIRKDEGLPALLTSQGPGGLMARRLIPIAVVLPTAVGWVCRRGELAGTYGPEAAFVLYAASNVLAFGGFVWATALLLHRSDLERRQAERKVRSQLERMNLLDQTTQAIGERQDLASIFQVVLRTLEESLPIDFGCICLREPGAEEMTVACVGVQSADLALELALSEQGRISIDQNGLARCLRGELVYEPDLRGVDFPFPRRLAAGGVSSVVFAPLRFESTVFGILVAARREPHTFSSGECEFLRQLGAHVALAAEQAGTYAALERAYQDLRQTQQAVLQQERLRALGQMASGIAHDINNAITPIALYTEVLLESEANLSPRTRDCLEVIQRATVDVAHTVDRLREYYRQREPQMILKPVELVMLARQVVDLTRARWSDIPQQKGTVIELQMDLEPDLPPVLGVEAEIREALTNLVLNAVDAMPDGGTLAVRARKRTDPTLGKPLIDFEIADTGTGMDEETKRRCLEPFFTTKGEQGTGLGLAMVYGLAQRHGADLEIESEPGRGTTVRLVFPAQETSTERAPSPASVALPPRLRILVVDDDPVLIKSLRETLEADGHIVETANGGQEGIDAFRAAESRKERFAVIITDLGMPRVDGRKVAAATRAINPSTPVILLTGWGQRLVAEGVPPHVDMVLSKPPKLRELRQALAEVSSHKGLEAGSA